MSQIKFTINDVPHIDKNFDSVVTGKTTPPETKGLKRELKFPSAGCETILILSSTVGGEIGPDMTLNEYIRNVADLRGTKFMCLEGGCGACIVSVTAADPASGELKTFAVNSCLVSALSCHNWDITTVEGIGNKQKGYHEIQTRLANFNGTQCGYCTPGWVMNMYSLYQSKNKKLSVKEIENSFAGNMCRCTGYRSIADAFKSLATDADKELLDRVCDLEELGSFKGCGLSCTKGPCSHINEKNVVKDNVLMGKYNYTKLVTGASIGQINENVDWCILDKKEDKMIVIDSGTHKWYKANSLNDIFDIIKMGEDYKVIAGNTGQGVYHITGYPKNVIDIFNVQELKGHQMDVNLILGAAMPLSEMMQLFLKMARENEDFSYLQQFYDHMDLVAHIPVRNIGTIGGNLCLKNTHKEFQSDVFLLFETVNGMVTIADSANNTSKITLPEFLKSNMKGKLLVNVILPPLSRNVHVKTFKIMPRSQNAHAIVNAGIMLRLNEKTNLIDRASIVFGSISPNFIHASKTEANLIGKDLFTNRVLQESLKILNEEITPEEDPPEPSANFRKMLAISLFYKAVVCLCPEDRLDKRYRSGGEALKRITSKGTQVFDTDKTLWPLTQPIPKLEALAQCSGEAIFANDLPSQKGELFATYVTADEKAGSIIESFDATEALKLIGVIAFYTAKDIPGDNTFTPRNVPFLSDTEEILCSKEVKFYGQPAGIIVATRDKIAHRAAKLVKIKYSLINKKAPLITIDDVLKSPEKSKRVTNNANVPPKDTGHDVKTVVQGEYTVNAQYHYTMELQTCVTRPTEGGMEVFASTQWLDLCNVAIAQALKVPVNSVNVIVRRLGGAYGGKISRSSQTACASALVTHLSGKPCRFILPLEMNMRTVGKRPINKCSFEAGVDANGQIQYLKHIFYQENGCSVNETLTPITLNHFHNCYDSKRWSIDANSVLTDIPSTTWCRAPASTEGIAMIEHIMERIAHNTNKDSIEVRMQNMRKENNSIPEMIENLIQDCNYNERSDAIVKFNKENRWRKRAIKIIPMLYDLFYFGNYSSVISIYHGDGTVALTHGGIEMGQGLNTKVAQVCAYSLGVPLEKVSVKPSNSFVTPNAIVTGGSIGSECISFATIKACEILTKRLEPIKAKMKKPKWEELIEAAYQAGVDLQASYMFTTKDDVKPYDIFGVVALELELDVLTGNHTILRVDLLEDIGRSISPLIDVGQIEGAFVMGLGMWTSEQLLYDGHSGELLTDRTWTYKPPGIKDIPADMRIYFKRNADNPAGVLQSKATGEPALCLAVVVTHALREAVRAARLEVGYDDQWVTIDNPCTVENIFMATQLKIEHFVLNDKK